VNKPLSSPSNASKSKTAIWCSVAILIANSFESAGDRPSDLVGSVLLHEVETSDDDAVLISEAARQSPDSARDEYTGLRVNKELWQRCCFKPCGIGGNPIVDIVTWSPSRARTAPINPPTAPAPRMACFKPPHLESIYLSPLPFEIRTARTRASQARQQT
jgi:hypothetical protein